MKKKQIADNEDLQETIARLLVESHYYDEDDGTLVAPLYHVMQGLELEYEDTQEFLSAIAFQLAENKGYLQNDEEFACMTASPTCGMVMFMTHRAYEQSTGQKVSEAKAGDAIRLSEIPSGAPKNATLH